VEAKKEIFISHFYLFRAKLASASSHFCKTLQTSLEKKNLFKNMIPWILLPDI